MTTVVTRFTVRGITAELQGDTWVFSWRGRRGSDSGALPKITYPQAVDIAHELAERTAKLGPLWDELEEMQQGIGEWLQSQREPT